MRIDCWKDASGAVVLYTAFRFFPRDRMVEKVRGRKGEREKKWRENSLKKEGDLCVDLSFVVK